MKLITFAGVMDALEKSAVRRWIVGVVLFIGFFSGLLWLLRDVINSVLAVLNATH